MAKRYLNIGDVVYTIRHNIITSAKYIASSRSGDVFECLRSGKEIIDPEYVWATADEQAALSQSGKVGAGLWKKINQEESKKVVK